MLFFFLLPFGMLQCMLMIDFMRILFEIDYIEVKLYNNILLKNIIILILIVNTGVLFLA